jgi:predicted GNAT family acetyltransferase
LPEVEQFARAWAERTGVTPERRIAQGVFALERVEPVTGVPGAMRIATSEDRPLLLEWFLAFGIEALPHPDEERLTREVDHRLAAADAGVVLWEHDGPVSLAGYGGPTPNGIRIGPVYTPPEFRGRGYASALVAELSSSLLAEGRQFCFLYTDLANPTSNKIYERIGYVRVCESAEIEFVKPS